ncbi:MAG: AAA family ATPase, partial [Fibrella sp.]|nr:AAA family ATPase [Armatimonadota bacterium]
MTDVATKSDSKANVMPNTAPLLQKLRMLNFLSFGPDAPGIVFGPLNILIGPNGAGKSNVIEAISLLRSCPVPTSSRDNSLGGVIRRGGGAEEWIWKGGPSTDATLTVVFNNLNEKQPLQHFIEFASEQRQFHLAGELVGIADAGPQPEESQHFYAYANGDHFINVARENGPRQLAQEAIEPNVSILAQRNDPDQYPEISYLIQQYGKVAIYRDWTFGRNSPLRQAQTVLGRADRLEEDFSNLFLFLNQLSQNPKTKRVLLERLRDLYDEVTDISFEIVSQFVRFHLIENDYRIPCERLSDGTLRYLCLLAILCDPTPPPLICIEE